MAAVLAAMGGGGGGGGGDANNIWNYHAKREEAPNSPRLGSPRSPRNRAPGFGKTLSHLTSDLAKRSSLAGEDESQVLPERSQEGSETDISQVVAYARLLRHDASVRRMNHLNLAVAVLTACAFLFEIWLAYDEDLCWRDWPIPGVNPDTGRPYAEGDVDIREKSCLQRTDYTWTAKCVISALTGLQFLGLVNYYRLQLVAEKRYWHIPDSFAWRKYIVVFFIVECCLLLPHPFPLPDRLAGLYDDKIGSLVFLRFYLFFRVLRDHSPIYQQRKLLLQDLTLKKTGAVDFNWLLSTRFLFMGHMWAFVIYAVLLVWFTMAYIIWIYEREHNKFFTPDISVWFTCITMTTVGYGDVNVYDGSARIITGFTVLLGVILGALLAYVTMYNLQLSPQDTRVRNLWTRKRNEVDQRRTAASYIALAWGFYKEKRLISDRRSQEFREARQRFLLGNNVCKSLLRSYRREIAMATDLDEYVIVRLEARVNEMTQAIADRFGYIMGLGEDPYASNSGNRNDSGNNSSNLNGNNQGAGAMPVGSDVDVKAAKMLVSGVGANKSHRAAHAPASINDRPNYAFTHLASLSRRISGMEKDQIATIEALDKLLVAVGFDEEDWRSYRLAKDAQSLVWRGSDVMSVLSGGLVGSESAWGGKATEGSVMSGNRSNAGFDDDDGMSVSSRGSALSKFSTVSARFKAESAAWDSDTDEGDDAPGFASGNNRKPNRKSYPGGGGGSDLTTDESDASAESDQPPQRPQQGKRK